MGPKLSDEIDLSEDRFEDLYRMVDDIQYDDSYDDDFDDYDYEVEDE